MSLTKAMLKGMGINEAQAGAILEAHAEARRAVEAQRDALQERLDAMEADRDWRGEYEALERSFNDYRAGVEAREALDAKRAAYRRLLDEARIPRRFHDRILRLADLDGLELDGDGFRDAPAAREAIRRDWGDYVAVDRVRGLDVDTPVATQPPGPRTVREIMAIEDDARREREIARNHELFGF